MHTSGRITTNEKAGGVPAYPYPLVAMEASTAGR
jgi:hypothetical protein